MEVALLRKAFDRFDRRPLGFGGEHYTTINGHAVHADVAGAAVAVIAALFRAGQAQVLAKDLEQALPRLGEEFGRFGLDRRRDMSFVGRSEWCVGEWLSKSLRSS